MIDIHSHQIRKNDEHLVYILDHNEKVNTKNYDHFCFGIHPWQAKTFVADSFKKQLIQNMSNPSFLALGEVGLDKVSTIPFDLQMSVFEQQIQMAKDFNINKIVLHNVKAQNEILQTLIKLKYNGQVLFHDFSANEEVAQMLLAHLDCYFSFGPRILDEHSKSFKTFMKIGHNKIFLETDDQTSISIEDLYKFASGKLNYSLEELTEQIKDNFMQFSRI